MKNTDDEAMFDIWASIQKVKKTEISISPPFSSILMSQHSLELCTEGLGSETGSDNFSYGDEIDNFFSPVSTKPDSFRENRAREEAAAAKLEIQRRRNIHCSNGRLFPPPLSSSCIQMKSVRSDGRLLLTAVPVPSHHNHLHAERRGGRLLMSFAKTYFQLNARSVLQEQRNFELDDEEEEVDDEVEEKEDKIVDCGATVEVNVSPHHQLVNETVTVKAFRGNGTGDGRLTMTAAPVVTPSDGFHCNRLHLHRPHRIDQIIWTVTS